MKPNTLRRANLVNRLAVRPEYYATSYTDHRVQDSWKFPVTAE